MKVHHQDGVAPSSESAPDGTAPPSLNPVLPGSATSACTADLVRAGSHPDASNPGPGADAGTIGATAATTMAVPGEQIGATVGHDRRAEARPERGDGLEDLVRRACAGQPSALSELVRRFTPLVRAVVRRAGVYGAEAEDVEQETWLRLASNIGQVREPAALPRWLSVTAGRLCTSLFDKRRRTVPSGDFSEDVWPSTGRWADPADLVCLQDDVSRLYRAIEGLTPRDRQLVRLLMDAVSYREISDTIAMPIGSIGPTRERVLRKLAGAAELRRSSADLVPAA